MVHVASSCVGCQRNCNLQIIVSPLQTQPSERIKSSLASKLHHTALGASMCVIASYATN